MGRHMMWSTLGSLLLGACGGGLDPACPPGSVAAISVHAQSAADGAPILDARGEVRDGNYADSLTEVGQGYYEAAQNRPGDYAVHLEHDGYASWDTSGIAVLSPAEGCPLILSTTVEARLVPIE
jgi:hypothetical protein